MQGKVEICGVNTARLKVLSQVEMDALLLQAKKGDKQAREKLIEGNLRLVLSVIQRFDKRGECPDDLFQVGCIGLIKAISNFDPTKQVRFSTYGVPTIIESRGNSKRSIFYDKKASIIKGNRNPVPRQGKCRGGSKIGRTQGRPASCTLVGWFHTGHGGAVHR